MVRSGLIVISIFMFGASICGHAQEVSFNGQIRPRFEFRDPVGTSRDAFTSMRVRVGITAAVDEVVSAFIQIQDVRLFGEETNTLTDFRADNLDIHQAYIDLRQTGQTTVSARVGRQELRLGGERLVGPVAWTQQGRAFDGVQLTAESNRLRIELLGAQLTDRSSGPNDLNSYLVGSYGTIERVGPGALDVFLLFNAVDGASQTNQATVGARWSGVTRGYQLRGEASYQGGNRAGDGVNAFMFGARIGRPFARDRASVTLWYDYLSGDGDPTDGDVRVFDTLFATNHKFYGYGDYFLNIPLDTGGRGLQDFAVKTSVAAAERLRLGLDVHAFRAAKRSGLSTRRFGEEIDVTASYRHSPNFTVTAGGSYLFAGAALAEIGRLVEDAIWSYLMLDVTF